MPEKSISTTIFRAYLYRNQKPSKLEGTIYLMDSRHKLSKSFRKEHFDHLDKIPGKIRKLLKAATKIILPS